MKANELMIGDWVSYENEPIMVWEIDEYYDRINTEPDGYNAITCIEISEVTPIPITPEILRKNEFMPISKDKYVYAQVTVDLNESLVIIKSKDARMIINIVYVHQLQHVLRLCGINKEITI